MYTMGKYLIRFFFSFTRGRKIFEPPRYMSVSQAADQLLQILETRVQSDQTSGEISVYLWFCYFFYICNDEKMP